MAAVEGIVTTPALRGRGLNRAIVEDLCLRLQAAGFEAVTALLPLASFFARHGFRADPRWGGLVRSLVDESRGGDELANSTDATHT